MAGTAQHEAPVELNPVTILWGLHNNLTEVLLIRSLKELKKRQEFDISWRCYVKI